jgi:hypothetical protein
MGVNYGTNTTRVTAATPEFQEPDFLLNVNLIEHTYVSPPRNLLP